MTAPTQPPSSPVTAMRQPLARSRSAVRVVPVPPGLAAHMVQVCVSPAPWTALHVAEAAA